MTKTIRLSLYKHYSYVKSTDETDLSLFLEDIRNGKWQDIVLPIRAERDEEKRKKLKNKLPAVTVSGLFSERKDACLIQHSGFITIDIDKLNESVETVKQTLSHDPHTYAAFTSASGTGLCLFFRIDGSRHREAFAGIEAYFYDTYRLIVDGSCRNESRLRFATFDPHIYINPAAAVFKRYLPKEKNAKTPQVVVVKDDFEAIVAQLADKNICEEYADWRRVGYGLADEFKETGRQYYHTLSAQSSKYEEDVCDKMYSNILKYIGAGKEKATIATVYWYAKMHGIAFYSDETKKILSSATTLVKSGLKEDAIVTTLQKYDNIDPAVSLPIVRQAIALRVEVTNDSTVDKIESWLRYNYEFTRNTITRKVLVFNRELNDTEFNSIFVAARKVFDTDATAEILDKIIHSSFTPDYDPFKHFFSINQHDETGFIDEYIDCFTTDKRDYFDFYFNKWLVGLVSSALGEHCPLMLVYTGRQGSGKTQAFRDLLPPALASYYAESKLDLGKDDEILMTKKLIICDDEMGGKNKVESRRLKELTSKQTFTIRVPYGRHSEDLRRLAMLCGTANDKRVIVDPTGNRRIIAVDVQKIDFARINRVDRTMLLMEAYRLLQSGFTHHLTSLEQADLNKDKEDFNDYSLEYELINTLILPPTDAHFEELSATEIKIQLEHKTTQKLNLNKLGSELQRLGYKQEIKRIDGQVKRVYRVTVRRPQYTSGLNSSPYNTQL